MEEARFFQPIPGPLARFQGIFPLHRAGQDP